MREGHKSPEPTQLTLHIVGSARPATTWHSGCGEPQEHTGVEKIVVDSKSLRSRMWEKVEQSGGKLWLWEQVKG
jgi:hypothetical protein